MKERAREALEKMPEDLPLVEFLDVLHGLIQVEASQDAIARGDVISNDDLWKSRPWRR